MYSYIISYIKKGWKIWEKKAINCTFFSQLNSSVGSNINRPVYIIFCHKNCPSIWLQLYYFPLSSLNNKNTDWKMTPDERSNQINKRWITKHFLLTSFQCFCLHGCNNNQPHSLISVFPSSTENSCPLNRRERYEKGVFRSW